MPDLDPILNARGDMRILHARPQHAQERGIYAAFTWNLEEGFGSPLFAGEAA